MVKKKVKVSKKVTSKKKVKLKTFHVPYRLFGWVPGYYIVKAKDIEDAQNKFDDGEYDDNEVDFDEFEIDDEQQDDIYEA